MLTEYTHLELGKDYAAGTAGHYTPQQEVRLKYDNREVLYITGQTLIKATCCGTGNWGYAEVPGYIVNWRNKRNEAGLPISEVEPIADKKAQDKIRQIIEKNEAIPQISFW